MSDFVFFFAFEIDMDCMPVYSVWISFSLMAWASSLLFLSLPREKVRGKFVMERPVYHHCSHLLPTVLHNKHWHKIKSLSKMALKIYVLPHLFYYCLQARQMLLQGRGEGWLVGWGGWKPLLQMDLELVRQQISSQAKRGGPANNFIFFSVQKRGTQMNTWKENSVLELACKLCQSSHISSLLFLLCQILSLTLSW